MCGKQDVAAIIMAAGLSSRMGKIKQLIKVDGQSMLDHSIQAAIDASMSRPIVVLGHEASVIAEKASLLHHCDIVINTSYNAGLSTSLISGIKATTPDTRAYLFMHADQPLIDGTFLQEILIKYKQKQADILYPTYRKKRGNPVIISAKLRTRLLKATGDSGAKFLFSDKNLHVVACPVSTPAILTDIDTPEDIQKLLQPKSCIRKI